MNLAIDRALRRADYFRRSPAAVGGPGGHKEWMHFCVYSETIDALINVSFVDDVHTTGADPPASLARWILLTRTDGWQGDIDTHDGAEVRVHAGRLDARLGDNEVRFRDGGYDLRGRLRDRPIAVDLRLEPVTFPSLVHNVEVEDGPPIHWLVLPRLRASGTVTVGPRTFPVLHAPAYHDHNWGHFGWGRDFAWEWGFGLPADPAVPWSLVFVRLGDRMRTRSMMQGLMLWKGARQHRLMRDHEVEVRHEGLLRPRRLCKIPGVMGLVSPGLATDVPQRTILTGRSGDDRIEVVFAAEDVAQVILPNDGDLGVTIINEVAGQLTLAGRVRGEPVAMTGRTIFEYLGA